MNVFTTPSGKLTINLHRIVYIYDHLGSNDYINIALDVADPDDGLQVVLRVYNKDGARLLAAYQNQRETN